MSCWRCGKPTPEGQTECEEHQFNGGNSNELPPNVQRVFIDWTKVKTVEDLRRIVGVLQLQLWVVKGSPAHYMLKDYTKEQ